MKDSITIKVSELRSMVQDIRRSGCDIVTLTINEEDEFDGETYPPYVSFMACKESFPEQWIDFESIDAIPNEDQLTSDSDSTVHISSNLL
ncbi:MAG: hypothetical protein BHW48_15220 [Roseburia sp. CAG:10041_57]|nr:MAG: hypothetical protein BHW48_15220 [Roseburia sp. CAG:10041_57]DAY92755.1 MAG TPA: hypothetical protein [Caudoviricetes sp.]